MRNVFDIAVVVVAVGAAIMLGIFALDPFNELLAEAMHPNRWGAGVR